MAFLSKVGNLLRQTASKQISSEFGASKPSFFQAIRCMSSMSSSKLFIGGATKLQLLVALRLYFFVVRLLILYFQVFHMAQTSKVWRKLLLSMEKLLKVCYIYHMFNCWLFLCILLEKHMLECICLNLYKHYVVWLIKFAFPCCGIVIWVVCITNICVLILLNSINIF